MGKVSKTKKISLDRSLLLFVVTAAILGSGLYLIGNNLGWFSAGSEEYTEYTTFRAISYTDGEDVSDFVEFSIYTWDPDSKYNTERDLRTISKFEETVQAKDAEDIKIDLTAYSYGVWIKVDPDGTSVFETEYYWLPAGQNYVNYSIYVHHLPSDVNFNILDSGMATWAVNESTSDNYTLYIDFPSFNTSGTHVGNDWDITDDDWDDLTDLEQSFYRDEANFRSASPIYSPVVDTDKDFSTTWERITTAYCIRFTMNTTIVETEGNAAEARFEVSEDYANLVTFKVIGVYVYMVFSQTIMAGAIIPFEANFGAEIKTTTVQSGTVSIPGDISSINEFAALSTIGA